MTISKSKISETFLTTYSQQFFLFGSILTSFGILLVTVGGSWDITNHLLSKPETFFSPPHALMYAGVAISWPDNWFLIETGLWGGGHGEENWLGEINYAPLPGAEPLSAFSGNPNLGVSNWIAFVISTGVLVIQGVAAWFIGQSIFKGKEVD